MAYEFKKLSDVNIVQSMSDNAHVLVEENGEIVKIPKDVTNKGLVKTINGAEPDENGDIALIENKTWQAIEMSSMPGMLNAYGIDAAEVSSYLRDNVYYHSIFYRIIMKLDGSVETRPHTHIDVIRQDDGTDDVIIYHGDDLAPIIVDVSENTITLDPDWVAPAEPIPAPATAEVGQVIAVKAVDENGKPTEWEAVSFLNRYIPFHNNNGEVSCALSFTEAKAIVEIATNTASASLNINKINSGILEISTYYSNCITLGVSLSGGTDAWIRFEFILPEGSVTYQFNPDETIVLVEE